MEAGIDYLYIFYKDGGLVFMDSAEFFSISSDNFCARGLLNCIYTDNIHTQDTNVSAFWKYTQREEPFNENTIWDLQAIEVPIHKVPEEFLALLALL